MVELLDRSFSIESMVDSPIIVFTRPRKTSMMILRDMVDAKKRELRFEIVDYPFDFFTDDAIACFLFDLDHLPLERVIERFEAGGGRILLHSESALWRLRYFGGRLLDTTATL